MQNKDIEIGAELARTGYSGIAKLKVLSKGHLHSGFGSKRRKDGVEVEVVEMTGYVDVGRDLRDSNRRIVGSRDLEPWGKQHDERVARIAAEVALKARVERVSDRLDIDARVSGSRVVLKPDDFFLLAERCEVDAS